MVHTVPSNPAEWWSPFGPSCGLTRGGRGHIYVSDAFDERFALSLPYVRIETGPMTRWADFMKVAIVNGIFFANAYIPQGSTVRSARVCSCLTFGRPQPSTQTPVRTFVTFNKGGDWEPIRAPAFLRCVSLSQLHLSGRSAAVQ